MKKQTVNDVVKSMAEMSDDELWQISLHVGDLLIARKKAGKKRPAKVKGARK